MTGSEWIVASTVHAGNRTADMTAYEKNRKNVLKMRTELKAQNLLLSVADDSEKTDIQKKIDSLELVLENNSVCFSGKDIEKNMTDIVFHDSHNKEVWNNMSEYSSYMEMLKDMNIPYTKRLGKAIKDSVESETVSSVAKTRKGYDYISSKSPKWSRSYAKLIVAAIAATNGNLPLKSFPEMITKLSDGYTLKQIADTVLK